MRIVCISDTHGREADLKVPKGDVLLHAGDFTARGKLEEVGKFDTWLAGLPHKHKVVIAGNHDFVMQNQTEEGRALLQHATYLHDEAVKIGKLNIWGSPWQPWFYDWAFNLQRGPEIREKWDLIPTNTDILITHGPPAHIGDKTVQGEESGCADLAEVIEQRVKPKVHLFGHIHEAYGKWKIKDTRYINASVCTIGYEAKNAPIVIDV